MDVFIKLNGRPDGSEKVNVDLQWSIDITKAKPGCVPKLFRKYNNIECPLQLNITDIAVPDEVVCDGTKLFSIIYDGKEVEQKDFPLDVTIKSMKTSFQLLFDKSMIKDCTRQQDANQRNYPITFNVTITDHKDNVIDSAKGEINLGFLPLGVKPNYEIKLDNTQIQYSSTLAREKVGVFETWIDEDFAFTPNQLETIRLKFYKGRDDISQFVSFDNGTREGKLVVTHGVKNKVSVPIYIDFTNIPNPIDDSEIYTIESAIVLSAQYSPEVTETILTQETFSLLKDQQGTELKVRIKMAAEEYILHNNTHPLPPFRMNVVPGNPLMGQVEVSLLNIATDNTNSKAGLHIKNLTLQETLQDSNVKVVGANNTLLTQFVRIGGRDLDKMCSASGHFIPNGPNAKSTISISLDPTGIIDVLDANDYTFSIQSTLTFDYYEDRDGVGIGKIDNSLWQQENVSIKWEIHLEPNPEWLCVDYGSSAIVCKYDTTILNLKERKDFLFHNESEGIRNDTYEKGTPFLSSDIVLHTVTGGTHSTLCSQLSENVDISYLELSVCLSPTSGLVVQDVRTQLPCLKILVGNEFLPNKPDYQTFQYSRLDKNNVLATVEAAKEKDEETCLLRISSIFHEAYATLFRFFIQPVCMGKSVNKLVLTYPNTYTPVHLKTLENIVLKTFPKVREGYLRFVSESDAVAAYYVENWQIYNKDGRNFNDDETILVYDMGAGTLDITLLKKHMSEGRMVVDILGKIGTGKAGNYLDYLICEIIRNKKILNVNIGNDIVSTKEAYTNQMRNERLNLKDVARNQIKPQLARNTITIKYNDNDIEFGGRDITLNPRFTKYLKEVTEDIIKQLLSFIHNNITIDTVLMSGRGCRLEALQRMLQSTMEGLGHSNATIKRIERDNNREKTAVVEGAMAYASIYSAPESQVVIRSRRLYASYGLIYKVLGGNFRYVELLSSADFPLEVTNSNVNDYEGASVNVSGTSASGTIKLVQTYLSPSDTEQAYNKDDHEFIAEMQEYNMAAFKNANTLNVKLKIDYKNNIYLYVNGMLSTGTPPRGVDLNSEITKRSIWPVTI